MTVKLEDVMKSLPKKQRDAIERRAQELIAEYQTLKELRKAQDLTQKDIAKTLKVTQENVSNLEKRSDMLISTLQNHVEAMGGELRITVKFPGRKEVRLRGLGHDSSAKG